MTRHHRDLHAVLKQLDRENYRLFEERVEDLEDALAARTAEVLALVTLLAHKGVISRKEMGEALAEARRRRGMD